MKIVEVTKISYNEMSHDYVAHVSIGDIGVVGYQFYSKVRAKMFGKLAQACIDSGVDVADARQLLTNIATTVRGYS